MIPLSRNLSDNLIDLQKLYLDLLKKALTRYGFESGCTPYPRPSTHVKWRIWITLIQKLLERRNLTLASKAPYDPIVRAEGRDWPESAETMIGLHRLDNIEYCVADVISRGVPGDLIETGVWRGGASIFMRAVLKAYRDDKRVVWVADSFQGPPKPNAKRYPADTQNNGWKAKELVVPLHVVKANFNQYGLLDDQVRFLEGFFNDSLPAAPIESLAVIRLDGDLYESTIDALNNLYHKLSLGGYLIIDDYNLPACKQAITNFRKQHNITEEIIRVDQNAVFWKRLNS